MLITMMLPLFFLAVYAATPVVSDDTLPANSLISSKTILSSGALLPYDAMLPLHTPQLSDKLTIWGEPFEFIAPGEYQVHLQPGYTLQEHFATIGKRFERPQIRCIGDHIADPEMFDRDDYMLQNTDQADIDLVRRDPRVEYVGLAVYGRGIDDAVPMEQWAVYEARLEQERLERDRIGKERIQRDEL